MAEPETFTVAEVCEGIRTALGVTFPSEIWVRGEITDLKRPKSGHVYFQLVDGGELGRSARATLAVALLADRKYVVNQILKRAGGSVRMSDGVEVRVRGRLDFHPPNGRLSLLMTVIDPNYTLGRLMADRERLLRQLAEAGLLRRQARLTLSPAPLSIALVTSSGSAAEGDFTTELERSGYGFTVRTVHAQVQGTGSATSVVRALRLAERRGSDLIVVARGGGARTDLATFDGEEVARAIAMADVPVWTGIGHEVDRSVADEVAHTAFKTPTAAAQALVERVGAFLGEVEDRWAAICGLAKVRFDDAAAGLDARATLLARDVRAGLRSAEDRLAERVVRVRREAGHLLRAADDRVAMLEARVAACDPQRALARGWSLTRTADGRLVRDPADAGPGATIISTVAGGAIRSTVVNDG